MGGSWQYSLPARCLCVCESAFYVGVFLTLSLAFFCDFKINKNVTGIQNQHVVGNKLQAETQHSQ